jgi:signal transduction histidine kinase
MTSAVVKDLCKPLAYVLSIADVASSRIEEGDESVEVYRDLQSLHQQAHRLMRMLEELLEFTCADSTLLNVDAVPLRSFLGRTLDARRPYLERVGIQLEVDLDLDPELTGPLDGERISRAIDYLLANARDALTRSACGAQGNRVWVRARAEKDRLVIRIADNGPGIPADIAGRLFEPFANETTRQGLGLGLATVRNLIKAHLGEVHVEAQAPEGGAAFTLKLPLGEHSGLYPNTRLPTPIIPELANLDPKPEDAPTRSPLAIR